MLLSLEVTCEHAWSLCYVEPEGQKCNKGLRVQQDERELQMLGSNGPILLMSMKLNFSL